MDSHLHQDGYMAKIQRRWGGSKGAQLWETRLVRKANKDPIMSSPVGQAKHFTLNFTYSY